MAIQQGISIHAPREGGDAPSPISRPKNKNFNPRPPRGGRQEITFGFQKISEISIHAPREGGDLRTIMDPQNVRISIHAPREGGDSALQKASTPTEIISIHAPREGGDYLRSGGWSRSLYFNPRPPRGGRLENVEKLDGAKVFQSTPPARGATRSLDYLIGLLRYFNPRPPRGGRLPTLN